MKTVSDILRITESTFKGQKVPKTLAFSRWFEIFKQSHPNMQNMSVLVAVVLLMIPGCTYLEDLDTDNSGENSEIIEPILGCTDSDAKNYDPQANEDDGSCEYEEPEPEPEPVLGCTDESAMNYDSNATEDDGSCEFMETIPCNGLVILCHRTY